MEPYSRYAVYYAPRPGPLAALATAWLGRDAETGQAVAQPLLAGIADPAAITVDARRYGFHGTLRAPFRLAQEVTEATVAAALADLAARLAPVDCTGLQLENLQGYLALTPRGCEAGLLDLAARVVEATDPFRAPLTAEDLQRRRPETLSLRQRAHLHRWGYPFVMEEFRFHLTLTDRLAQPSVAMAALADHFAPVLDQPFRVEDLCLFGEGPSGAFRLLHRYALTG